MRKYRILKFIAGIVVLAVMASSCGYEDPLALGDDKAICVYGNSNKRGNSLQVGSPHLPDGSTFSIQVHEDDVAVEFPLSNRFYEISTRGGRDAGALLFHEVFLGNTLMRIETKNHFVFNADATCSYFDAHGRRNTGQAGTYCDENRGNCTEIKRLDMGFNTRGGIISPWIVNLHEQHQPVLTRALFQLFQEFGEQGLEWDVFNFNSSIEVQLIVRNDEGFPVDADGNIVENEADAATETVSRPAWDVVESAVSPLFSDRLNREYGDSESDRRFFCNTGHNQSEPLDCEDIRVEILAIYPADNTLVEGRFADIRQEEDDKQAILAAERAQDHGAELLRIANENAIAEDERLILEQRLSDQRVLEDSIDQDEAAALAANRETAEDDAGLDAFAFEQARLDAFREVGSICEAAQAVAIDCVYLIAARNGVELPPSLGGTFTIPQAPG